MALRQRYATYREMLNTGLFSSEANCSQYLFDVKILPDKRRCSSCSQYMMIEPCSDNLYREGCCWKCCQNTASIRNGSVLEKKKLLYRQFIDILGEFSRDSTIKDAADNTGTSPQAVRLVYTTIRERMAETIVTHDRIGGPGTIVEIDEAKFGKRKYNRGRLVEGSWVLGGIQRDTKKCFLAVCPDNKRSERALLPIIQQYVAPGTTIITDKWKAYINLSNHGYVHLDVNHSQNFVDPQTGAHTNSIEGTWTHVKNRALQRGGRRTEASLDADLTHVVKTERPFGKS